MSCLLPSFSFHTHILFCSPLPCPCRCLSSPRSLSFSLPLTLCVCMRVFAFVFFHPIFVVYFYLHLLLLLILLFVVVVVLRALLWATNSWNSFLHFFLVAAHTFPAGKTSFSRRRLRMHSSSCLFTVRNAGASWIRRKEQRKQTTRSALSHFDLSLSLSSVDSICVDDIVKVVYECKREGEGNYVVVCSCFSGKTRQALNNNNNNNNYKALNVQ